jgi:Recombination endonuclease VII
MAIIDGKIKCNKCGEDKLLSQYTPYRAQKGSGACNQCRVGLNREERKKAPRDRSKVNAAAKKYNEANREKVLANALKWRQGNKDKTRAHRYKSEYGVTLVEYEQLLRQQGGNCACCGCSGNPDGKRMAIDHCHQTGKIRGILCRKCNAGIGMLGDNIEGLLQAINYLRR